MHLIKTKSFELAIISRGDQNAKKVAILLPGRLDTKDYVNFQSHAEYLAARGFFVLVFDPPGTWESPGEINLFTTTNYLVAVNELIDYLGDRSTLLIGHSRGAAVAILASINQAVTAIVPIMANYDDPSPSEEALRNGFHVSSRDLPPGSSKTLEQKEFALPIAYWEDGKKYNPSEILKKCTKPKLLIYGTEDSFTPPSMVKELYEIIPEPKMIKEVNCAHDYRYSTEAITEIENEIGRFLDRYDI